LNIKIIVLKSVVNCGILGLVESYQGTCFGHAFSKAYQYGTIDDFFCKELTYDCIKIAQKDLQKCITWPKQSKEGGQQWTKTCVEFGLAPRKLNTLVKTK
jgi:hypothetical protein